MKKRITRRVLVLCLTLNLMIGICAAGYTGNQADDIVTTALSQVGYTAGWNDDTKYGNWYGQPHAYWCAMFVSWCARNAGISSNTIPQFSSCTAGMNWFARRGLWRNSAWRGDNYVPRHGDLIFFNWTQKSNCNHVGIVIKTDGGYIYTIEGNALTYRWEDRGSPDPDDPMRVSIRRYPLDSNLIRGYASPNYSGRQIYVPEPQGFIDVVDYANQRDKIQVISDMKLLPPLSPSIYGELHRATRGDFVSALVNIFCLDEVKEGTKDFNDLPKDSPIYQQMLVARSAGIILGDEWNNCAADAPLTAEAARNFFYRTEAYMQGAMAWMNLGTDYYVVRGRLAVSLYDILTHAQVVTSASMTVTVNGQPRTLAAYQSGNAYYVKLQALRAILEDTDQAFDASWTEEAILLKHAEKIAFDPTHQVKPTDEWRRILNKTVKLNYNGQISEINAITINGETCYRLDQIVTLLGADLKTA